MARVKALKAAIKLKQGGGEGASGRHERREGGGGKGSGKGSDKGDGGSNGHVQALPWKRQTNQG